MVDIIPIEVARAHCRTDASDDALVAFYLDAAIADVEKRTGLALAPQVVTQTLDAWPRASDRLASSLLRWPVSAVTGVTYLDTDAEVQTLDAPLWRAALASRPGRVIFSGAQLPRLAGSGAVTITYQAGFADPADVPANVKQAALLLLAEFFGNREAGALSDAAESAVAGLLRYDKRRAI